jgi:GNAT superfamily N-acetyltransferase
VTIRATIEDLDTFWAAFLGCETSHLYGVQVAAVPQRIEGGDPGVFVFQRAIGVVVAVVGDEPAALYSRVVAAVDPAPAHRLLTREFWAEAFADRVAAVSGPDWVLVADKTDFTPVSAHRARPLAPAERGEYSDFLDRLPGGDRKACGLDPYQDNVQVMRLDDGIVSAAAFDGWAGRIAQLSAVTRPGRRGRGHAKAVLSAAGRDALLNGMALEMRVEEGNLPGVATARALGFAQYARVLSVRIQP